MVIAKFKESFKDRPDMASIRVRKGAGAWLVVALVAVLGAGVYFVFFFGAGERAPGADLARAVPAEGARAGAWVDEVVFREEPDRAKALDMFEAGEIHVYAAGINDPEIYRRIQASTAIEYETSYGSNVELTFNPVGPAFPRSGELNPFHVPAIREAMNWLIDRDYIAEEIYGGLAVPRSLALISAFPDYARLADVARQLEVRYAYDPERARAVIGSEMKKLGAESRNGRWHYQGKPVRIIFLIRPDDRRRGVGDYVATLLEDVGFVVDRQYKTPTEASPIWIGSDPADGRWHIYTGGWINLAINRDQAGIFNSFYTARGRPDPLWQAYKPEPRFDEVAERLGRRDYATSEERTKLIAEALERSMKDSVRVWLVDGISIWPRRREVQLAADLAGGISGSGLLPYTVRFEDKRSGRVHVASPSMLTEPWNPVAGSNWIFDNMIIRATQDFATLPDPFTGLFWPQRVASAEVHVQEGLPVTRTHDWLALKFVPSIEVAGDAWIDWDAKAQRFVTVSERRPKGVTARTRTVIRYADDFLETRWHDGSRMSIADLVFSLILGFDRAKPESPLFDEAAVPAFETFMRHFRGARIVQERPLVLEIYSDQLYPDAETIAATRANDFYTSAPWHKLALGTFAEASRELAFSSAKADRLKVEWTSYIAGPSLAVLDRRLAQALEEGSIPYRSTLEHYVSREEAIERYERLRAWRESRRHFWVGTGPLYLHGVHPVEKIVVLRKFDLFPDPPEKWVRFVEPRIAETEVSGPRMVQVGSAAQFDVKLAFQGEPYPAKDIEFVRFLLFDAQGRIVERAEAQAVRDGLWRISLTAEQTRRLPVGANRLEVVATSRAVAVPSFKSFLFVSVREPAS
jgi:peptide/nickel transport system substrate-binding protein